MAVSHQMHVVFVAVLLIVLVTSFTIYTKPFRGSSSSGRRIVIVDNAERHDKWEQHFDKDESAPKKSAEPAARSASSVTEIDSSVLPTAPSAGTRPPTDCDNRLKQYSWPGAKYKLVDCEKEDVHCFVKQALRLWIDKKISKDSVERTWRGQTPGEFCCLMQIINNQVYFFDPVGRSVAQQESWRADLYNKRIDAIAGVIKAAATNSPLPDMEFPFCIGDCVSHFNPTMPDPLPENEMVPSFTVVQCLGASSIPIPLFDVYRPPNDVSLTDWPAAVVEMKKIRESKPWAQRNPQVAFRGGARGCQECATPEGYSYDSQHNAPTASCSRVRAMEIARGNANFDFEGHGLDMPGHENFKYVMYLHGHCHWANRLRRLLFMGMGMFKQAGVCDEFYGMRLKPWVHYIPVDYNLFNMTASVEWALKHDAEVLAMIDRMHEYAEAFNTAQFAIDYTHELLKAYAAKLDYKVEQRPNGQPRG